MKTLCFSLSFASLLATATLSAQSPWRFSAGYAPMVGLRTEFTAAPVPRYLDGSIDVDSSGNLGGQTTNFSYQNNSQYDAGLGVINFTRIVGGGLGSAGTTEESSAAAGGFELAAFLDLGHVSFIPSAVPGRSASWGLRMGGQYARVDVDNRDTLSATVGTVTDSYSTGGGVPPLAPYTGSFNGPGFQLGSIPTASATATGTAVLGGSRQLDVHIAAAQFGAYLQIPVAKKLDVTVEGGVILALATGSYRYDTSLALGAASQNTSAYERRTRLLPGFYAGVGLLYHLTERLGLQAGVRYQFMKEFEIEANGSTAAVSFDNAFALSLGAVYSF